MESLYRTLELSMVNQREENISFQEQITELRKEKAVLSQMIVGGEKKIEFLKEEVGHY